MTVIDFATRKKVGDSHEERVRTELERRGWTVAAYGQGVLPEPITRALGRTNSRLRWDPDLIAARGQDIALIDAKASMRGADAWSYTISKKALQAGLQLWAELDLPVLYVFDNLGVATPAEVLQFCRVPTPSHAAAWLSFATGLPKPFDDVFGPAIRPAHAADLAPWEEVA